VTKTKHRGPFGGLGASEAAQRSAERRAIKAEERRAEAADNALTFRQRLGVALSRLSQRDLDAVIQGLAKSGKPQDINTLARLADQAFGKPQDAEEDSPIDPELAALTREQRALLREWLLTQADAETQGEDERSGDDAVPSQPSDS
jgi:hypothetical protein